MQYLRCFILFFLIFSKSVYAYEISLNINLGYLGDFNRTSLFGQPESLNQLLSFQKGWNYLNPVDLERNFNQDALLLELQEEQDLKQALFFVLRKTYVFIALFIFLFSLTIYFLVRSKREVKKRIKAELELASQLKLHQEVVEAMPYPVAIKNHLSQYQLVNAAFEKITGKKKSELIGQTAVQALSNFRVQEVDIIENLTKSCLSDGQAKHAELSFEDIAGNQHYGFFWVTPCYISETNEVALVSTIVDVTKIRHAEQKSREVEKRLLDVTQSLPVIVFQIKRDALGIYSISYMGGEVDNWFKSNELTKIEDIFSRIEAEDRQQLKEKMEHSALQMTRLDTEFQIAAENGLRWIHATFVPKKERAQEIIWSGYFSDVTHEKQKEAELSRARDIAEAASKAKDSFLAMMSHEIRTPMSGALGLLEVLEKTPINPEQKSMLSMIHDSADTLLRILDDILDFSKIQAGHLTIEEKEVDLRQLIDQSIALLASRAYQKGLKLRFDVSADVAAIVYADGVRIHQILFNLLSNAIKFTSEGEVRVMISAKEVDDSKQKIVIQVQDTGKGIPKEIQAILFDPFVQVKNEHTIHPQGTGLGLAICKKIVELMNGSLTLESEEGKGATFSVHLCLNVVAQNYTSLPLLAKSMMIITENKETAINFKDFAQTLGMFCYVAPSMDNQFIDEHAEKFDLIFVDEKHREILDRLTYPAVVELTDKPKVTGYRFMDNKVRLSINPISWRSFQTLCLKMLSGDWTAEEKEKTATTTATTTQFLSVPSREEAIQNKQLILVAEDHPVSQSLIRYQLGLLGFACDIVDDGYLAYEACKKNEYALLITDCHMPELPGYDLAKKIREDEKQESHLPIIGITASTATVDHQLFYDHGVDQVLVKPIQLSVLAEAIQTWLVCSVKKDKQSKALVPILNEQLDVHHEKESAFAKWIEEEWGKSVAQEVLAIFIQEMRQDIDLLNHIANANNESFDLTQLRQWCHRALGASVILKYQPMIDLIEKFQAVLKKQVILPKALFDFVRSFIQEVNQELERVQSAYQLLSK